MEKQIVQVSYWLGLVSSLLAVGWKALEALNAAPGGFGNLRYMTFYKGALLFLLVSIATSGCAWLKSQKA